MNQGGGILGLGRPLRGKEEGGWEEELCEGGPGGGGVRIWHVNK